MCDLLAIYGSDLRMVFIVEDKGLIIRTKLPSNSSGQAFSRFAALATG